MNAKGKVDVGPYTKIPNRFFGSGLAARLGSSAGFLYVALCDHANRNGSNTFKASDKALASDTGMGTRTICNARQRLCEHGLISFERPEGQSYKYTISKPSLEWVRLEQRLRAKRRPRALHAQRAVSPQQNLRHLPPQNLLPKMQALLIPRARFADPSRCFR